MRKWIEWPVEDIVLEICWNGDPDNCTVIPREFLPAKECQYCKHYYGDVCSKEWNNRDESDYVPERDDREAEDTCDDWEWDEDMDDLLDSPRTPKREDYKTERSYLQAKKAVRQWIIQQQPEREE